MTSSEQFDSFGGPGGQSFFEGVRDGAKRRGPVLAGAAAFLLLAALGAVIWASYPRHGAATDPNAAPLIRADAAPWRVKPDDPGGMDIPYRDSTVFNALHGEASAAGEKVENLLPQPEQPLPREKLIPGYQLNESEEGSAPVTVPVWSSETETAPPPEKPVEAAPVAAAAPAAEKTEPASAAAAPPAEKTEPAPAAVHAAGYFVQLGSVRAEADAAATWKKLQAAHSVLAGLALRVEKADLGAKGVHYRLQGGPLAQQKAKDICAAVVKRKAGGCLVVKH